MYLARPTEDLEIDSILVLYLSDLSDQITAEKVALHVLKAQQQQQFQFWLFKLKIFPTLFTSAIWKPFKN